MPSYKVALWNEQNGNRLLSFTRSPWYSVDLAAFTFTATATVPIVNELPSTQNMRGSYLGIHPEPLIRDQTISANIALP